MRILAVELASAAALCALAGCTVPMQTVDASRAACASYGFQPGSDAFAECVQKEQLVHTLVLVPTDAPVVPEMAPLPVAQAPTISLPSLPQPQTQFCFGAGAFQQCQ
jgi:hypothetical protein